MAGGLRVPVAIGSRMMLQTLRESNGTAIAITDNAIREAQSFLAASEGIFACMEGAATAGALHPLLEEGWLKPDERVLIFNTGSGLKHRLLLT